MKKVLIYLLAFVTLLGALAFGSPEKADATQRVRGYYHRNGTYVLPHYRSHRNYSRWDNWSTRGNYNPFTGRRGYQSPYRFRY